MGFRLTLEDEIFRNAFESGKVSPAEFSHRAHIRLAYVYLCEHPPEAAYQKMKKAIQSFLAHHDIDADKYHETLTRAWIMAVHHFMICSADTESASEFTMNNPRLLETDIMLTHYTQSTLFSQEARRHFVEPNLSAIPKHV